MGSGLEPVLGGALRRPYATAREKGREFVAEGATVIGRADGSGDHPFG